MGQGWLWALVGYGKEFEFYSKCKRKSLEGLEEQSYVFCVFKESF